MPVLEMVTTSCPTLVLVGRMFGVGRFRTVVQEQKMLFAGRYKYQFIDRDQLRSVSHEPKHENFNRVGDMRMVRR